MLGELPVLPEDIREIQDRAESGKFESGEGTFHRVDTGSAYEEMLRSQYGQGKCVPLHVVIDAGNGAMSETAPRVMEALGLRVTRLYCSYDGTFPNRDPNPAVQKNLSALCLKVKEVQADFGAVSYTHLVDLLTPAKCATSKMLLDMIMPPSSLDYCYLKSNYSICQI